MASQTPEFLGPYRVLRLLGRGGMGTVYEAVHSTSQERVAVKIVSDELAHEQRFQRRFEAEIQTLLRLKHPNIVRLIGTGVHQSLPFYSMEFIEGENLHAKLKLTQRIEWEQVLEWAISIASALKQAHDFGIIHRDLKPANLMITPDGEIKLLDFGISRLFGSASATMPGSTVGTADFMPPEQAEGTSVSPRSDLYALGAICYACLAGRPPFIGKSVPEILFNVRYGVYTPLAQLADGVPEEFCTLVDELLSREPNKRPATAYLTMNRLQALRAGLRQRHAERSDSVVQPDESNRSGKLEHPGTTKIQDQTSVDISALPSVAGLSDSPYHDATRIDPPGGSKSDSKSQGKAGNDRQVAADSGRTPALGAGRDKRSNGSKNGSDEATQEHISSASIAQESNAERSTERGSSFSVISERDRERASIFDTPDPVVTERQRWTEIGLLLAGLVSCAIAFYYFTRPVDPSRLYDPIFNAMTSGDESRLLDLEEQIEAFKVKYPDDERIDKIELASAEVDYLKRLRHLQRSTSNKYQGQEAMVSVLREIVRSKEILPDRSKSMLVAFLDAYPDEILSDEEKAWIRFGRKLLSEMESKSDPESEKVKVSQLESLYNRIMASELPLERDKALRGMIELYGKEPWAMPIVTKATAELKNLIPGS